MFACPISFVDEKGKIILRGIVFAALQSEEDLQKKREEGFLEKLDYGKGIKSIRYNASSSIRGAFRR